VVAAVAYISFVGLFYRASLGSEAVESFAEKRGGFELKE
jgi:hypothetical protein